MTLARFKIGGGPRLVALMCAAEMLCMAGFATYPALLPVLRAEWSLSNTAAGFVGGILFFGYVVSVPVLTSLTDRIDARRVYLVSCLIAASGSAAFALFAHGFVGALIAQALFGVGFAGVYMPGLKAMSDRIDEALQSRATALYTSLSGFGLAGSYFLTGIVSAHASWRLAFALATIGPLVAAAVVFLFMPAKTPTPAASRPGFLTSFALVFKNKPALGYILGYVSHCWELYGSRAWMVAFLTFAAGSTAGVGQGASAVLDAPTLASIISLGGIASSIGCNEFAKRFGRANLVTAIMLTGFAFGVATGLSWRLSLIASVACLACYYAAVMADSGALTAGTVAAAKPEQRGATLGVHSMLGFTAGLVAPTSFGVILDLAGGARSGWAWAASFIVLALPNLIAIAVLRALAAPSQAPSVVTRFAAPLDAQRDLADEHRARALGR
jgi:MFS family permease